MPRLSEKTRAQRRQHILTSAWTCFSRGGFHTTSMDQVIAATGMSARAVYRYFGSKEEIIHASAEEGVTRVRDIFSGLLDRDSVVRVNRKRRVPLAENDADGDLPLALGERDMRTGKL